MHFVNSKSILSKDNGMNIYRGCTHGCIYCDSRSNVYGMNHDFEDVEVKENSLKLLRKQLHNKKEKCMIGIGSMSDPYMDIENKLQYTRKTLELVYKYGHGFTCITKSDLVLRDIDLLRKINEKGKVVIQMSLTCMDDSLSEIIEPDVVPTSRRIEVLNRLQDEGIPTVVWLCPILPYITDTEENINGILDSCIQSGVEGVICFNMGLTLRGGNREYFYQKLDEHFPHLREVYEKQYGNSYGIASPHNKELMKIFYDKTCEYNIMNNVSEIFNYLKTFPHKSRSVQTKLF